MSLRLRSSEGGSASLNSSLLVSSGWVRNEKVSTEAEELKSLGLLVVCERWVSFNDEFFICLFWVLYQTNHPVNVEVTGSTDSTYFRFFRVRLPPAVGLTLFLFNVPSAENWVFYTSAQTAGKKITTFHSIEQTCQQIVVARHKFHPESQRWRAAPLLDPRHKFGLAATESWERERFCNASATSNQPEQNHRLNRVRERF